MIFSYMFGTNVRQNDRGLLLKITHKDGLHHQRRNVKRRLAQVSSSWSYLYSAWEKKRKLCHHEFVAQHHQTTNYNTVCSRHKLVFFTLIANGISKFQSHCKKSCTFIIWSTTEVEAAQTKQIEKLKKKSLSMAWAVKFCGRGISHCILAFMPLSDESNLHRPWWLGLSPCQ